MNRISFRVGVIVWAMILLLVLTGQITYVVD